MTGRSLYNKENKTERLARMLSAYDDETWRKLKENRRNTYRRAAATLLHDWRVIFAQLEEWDELDNATNKETPRDL